MKIVETLFFSQTTQENGVKVFCVKNAKGKVIATGSMEDMKALAVESRKKFPLKSDGKNSPKNYEIMIQCGTTKIRKDSEGNLFKVFSDGEKPLKKSK